MRLRRYWLMRISSFAKINLGLEVLRKREDNYHELRTLFQTIDFYDVLEFHPFKVNRILLKGDDQTISWDESNLIFKAAALLKKQFGVSEGVEILVTKKIPPGKGLGGGSSNTAVTLYALNKIWGLGLEKKTLMDLGGELGADVPFFLEGGLCLGSGRGDEIVALPDLPSFFCLLVLPPFSIATSFIFSEFQLSLTSSDKGSKIIQFLDTKELNLLENKLEETIFCFYPQLKSIKSLLRSQGAELTLVTGTGAAVFGLFLEKGKAERALEVMKGRYESVLVETLSREQYRKTLETGV